MDFTDWLVENLKKEEMRSSISNLMSWLYPGHIPGAIYLPEGLLRCTEETICPSCTSRRRALEQVFRRRVWKRDIPARRYTGTGRGQRLGRRAGQTMNGLQLDPFGHNLVYVLDGASTMEGGRQTLTKDSTPVKASDFAVQFRRTTLSTTTPSKAIKGRQGYHLWMPARRTPTKPEILDQARSHPRRDQRPLEIPHGWREPGPCSDRIRKFRPSWIKTASTPKDDSLHLRHRTGGHKPNHPVQVVSGLSPGFKIMRLLYRMDPLSGESDGDRKESAVSPEWLHLREARSGHE